MRAQVRSSSAWRLRKMKDHGPRLRRRYDERSDNRWGNDPLELWLTVIGIAIMMLSVGVMIGMQA